LLLAFELHLAIPLKTCHNNLAAGKGPHFPVIKTAEQASILPCNRNQQQTSFIPTTSLASCQEKSCQTPQKEYAFPSFFCHGQASLDNTNMT
jgi:hypothetical protein